MKKLLALVALPVLLSACMSMQNNSTLEAITGQISQTQPYVEAYVEYTGPQARWAGPSSFLLHVSAKEAGAAKITTTPAMYEDMTPAPTVQRVPASEGARVQLSAEDAREYLAHLATAVQGPDPAFRGCLSPVRVRLIRADGGLLEKQGCRSQGGWARVASDMVSEMIQAKVHGVQAPAEATRAPASVSDKAGEAGARLTGK